MKKIILLFVFCFASLHGATECRYLNIVDKVESEIVDDSYHLTISLTNGIDIEASLDSDDKLIEKLENGLVEGAELVFDTVENQPGLYMARVWWSGVWFKRIDLPQVFITEDSKDNLLRVEDIYDATNYFFFTNSYVALSDGSIWKLESYRKETNRPFWKVGDRVFITRCNYESNPFYWLINIDAKDEEGEVDPRPLGATFDTPNRKIKHKPKK